MQTVITWTRYDGTPETLPEDGEECIVRLTGEADTAAWHYDADDGWYNDGIWGLRPTIGDTWAPVPAAPQGVE